MTQVDQERIKSVDETVFETPQQKIGSIYWFSFDVEVNFGWRLVGRGRVDGLGRMLVLVMLKEKSGGVIVGQ